MKPLLADRLAADPRVAQAKALLAEALREHQASLTQPLPSDPDRQAAYADQLEQFARLRAGALYYPYLGSGIGYGPFVELADGSVKYDLIGGIGVHPLGHSHPALLMAGIDAALSDTLMQGNLQQHGHSVSLLQRLVDLGREGGAAIAHGFLSTSGAMANENALKLALHRHTPADRILAFEDGFAGRTLALANITDRPAFRVGLPETVAVDHVPFFDALHPEESTRAALATLGSHLRRHPGRHAVFVMELVQGEGGYRPGDRVFFQALCERLREHQVAILFDEIQTFGRTTRPFAFQHFGLDAFADLVTVGKLTQLCVTLFTERYAPAPGLLGQTFTASTSALFAAGRVIDTLQATGCFGSGGRNMQVHRRFVDHFEAIAGRHPDWIRGPYGLGAMIAFTPFDGSDTRVKVFLKALFDHGVIGFVAGGHPTRVRFLPPVPVLDDADIDRVCHLIEATLAEVAGA